MAEIRVPTLGESVTEATIGKWFKKPGEAVAVDEPLVELETDKVTIEVPAPAAGVLADIAAKDGDTVAVGAVLGQITDGPGAVPAGRPDQKTERAKAIDAGPETPQPRTEPPPPLTPSAVTPPPAKPSPVSAETAPPLAPSVRRLSAESGVDAAAVPGTGKDGRVTKGDMLAAIERAAAFSRPRSRRRPPRSTSARHRRPTTRRARSACA